jgi:5-methylcytosine-specific restriction endonuclease McrA
VCVACAEEHRKAYKPKMRERVAAYRAKNREACVEWNRGWRDRNRERIREYNRQRYYADVEVARAIQRDWARRNAEKLREKDRQWREANPERVRERYRKWTQENRDKTRVYRQQRRARELNAEGSFTAEDVARIFAEQGGRCAYCGEERKLTIDHKKPLSRGGSNDLSNLVGACRSCNSRKGARELSEFLRSRRRPS